MQDDRIIAAIDDVVVVDVDARGGSTLRHRIKRRHKRRRREGIRYLHNGSDD